MYKKNLFFEKTEIDYYYIFLNAINVICESNAFGKSCKRQRISRKNRRKATNLIRIFGFLPIFLVSIFPFLKKAQTSLLPNFSSNKRNFHFLRKTNLRKKILLSEFILTQRIFKPKNIKNKTLLKICSLKQKIP